MVALVSKIMSPASLDLISQYLNGVTPSFLPKVYLRYVRNSPPFALIILFWLCLSVTCDGNKSSSLLYNDRMPSSGSARLVELETV